MVGGFVGADAVAAASANIHILRNRCDCWLIRNERGSLRWPAFNLFCGKDQPEGVNISCSMQAEPGAIFAVNINNNVTWQVIGGETIPPKGCVAQAWSMR